MATIVTVINSNGTMVGGFATESGGHGFILRKGQFTFIDVPGALESRRTTRGFVWADGAFHDIDIPGAELNFSQGINAKRQVVGAYALANTNLRGFVVGP